MTHPKPKNAMLVPNASKILRRAWSIRFTVLAGILSATEAGLALTDHAALGMSPGTFAIAAALSSGAGFIARFLAQRGMED